MPVYQATLTTDDGIKFVRYPAASYVAAANKARALAVKLAPEASIAICQLAECWLRLQACEDAHEGQPCPDLVGDAQYRASYLAARRLVKGAAEWMPEELALLPY